MKALGLMTALDAPLSLVRQAFAWGWGGGHGPWGWWSCPAFGGWGTAWPGIIMNYGFWGLVIALLILPIRRLTLTGRVGMADAKGSSQALEILKQRYAKGEITEGEFRGIRKDLQRVHLCRRWNGMLEEPHEALFEADSKLSLSNFK